MLYQVLICMKLSKADFYSQFDQEHINYFVRTHLELKRHIYSSIHYNSWEAIVTSEITKYCDENNLKY